MGHPVYIESIFSSPYLDVWPAEALAGGDVTLVVVGAPGVTVTSLAAIRVRLRQPVMLRQTLNTKVSGALDQSEASI